MTDDPLGPLDPDFAARFERDTSRPPCQLYLVSPLDVGTVVESVKRTGRLVVVHEAPQSFGVGAELAARVTEAAFYSLEAPVLRVTGYDTPYPPSRLEHEWLPNLDRVLDTVDKVMTY